jgi:hypothetical protein
MVKGPMLVVFRHIEMDQLGTSHEHCAHAVDVTGADGVNELVNRHNRLRLYGHSDGRESGSMQVSMPMLDLPFDRPMEHVIHHWRVK